MKTASELIEEESLPNSPNRRKGHIVYGIDAFIAEAHTNSKEAGWWDEPDTVETVPAKLCLIHSEVSEAMEGARKDLMDDKLPHRKMVEVELADAMIRIADLAGHLDLDLAGAIVEKMEYNKSRSDHKRENRQAEGGKKF